MNKIPFDEKELEVVGIKENVRGNFHIYNTPISSKQNFRLCYDTKCPMWEPVARGIPKDFTPMVIPDNIARAFVYSGENFANRKDGGGPDMYGMVWELVPTGGCMIRPGTPALLDANDWKEVIKLPDVDSWDWEGSVRANAEYLEGGDWTHMVMLSGAWFERLISFRDFEGAVLALVDDDQKDAVKELFSATTDILCRIIDKVAEYFPTVDAITVHDDWGGQANPFFSEETAMEMIVPYMRKLTDHIREKGMVAVLHSCGHNEARIECYIAAGWQSWNPQDMNDTPALYDRYGDRIILTVNAELKDGMSEQEQIEAARDFARRYCKPGKPSMAAYDPKFIAFEKELYRCSRLAYMGESF